MNTGNNPTHVNERRKRALELVKATASEFMKIVDTNIEEIKSLAKAVDKEGKSEKGKELKDVMESLIIRNKAILAELKPINKQIEILQSRIVNKEVARSTRTKKDRRLQGRRRRIGD